MLVSFTLGNIKISVQGWHCIFSLSAQLFFILSILKTFNAAKKIFKDISESHYLKYS